MLACWRCGSAVVNWLPAPRPGTLCSRLDGTQGALNLNIPAGAWGDLKGIQCACLVEVVEHLDPEPLRALGACVLGALQPGMLVVTTPNREYNPLLHTLGSALLPNKLRNSDHRFEW